VTVVPDGVPDPDGVGDRDGAHGADAGRHRDRRSHGTADPPIPSLPVAESPAPPAPGRPGPALGWQPAVDETIVPSRPSRPVGIEFASTVFIVSGIFRLLAVSLAIVAPADAGLAVEPAIAAVEVAIQVGTVVLGVLVRYGRAWLLAANFAAVFAFIQLLSLVGVVSVAFGILFAVAFVAIFLNRPWFLATAAWRRSLVAARRA
jgi:hypothetical protein